MFILCLIYAGFHQQIYSYVEEKKKLLSRAYKKKYFRELGFLQSTEQPLSVLTTALYNTVMSFVVLATVEFRPL